MARPKKKKLPTKPKFREYSTIRNYADYRCHKVRVTFTEMWRSDSCPSEFEEHTVKADIESWAKGQWCWRGHTLYFANSEDALVAGLKYP